MFLVLFLQYYYKTEKTTDLELVIQAQLYLGKILVNVIMIIIRPT